jgi:hypothetical protein
VRAYLDPAGVSATFTVVSAVATIVYVIITAMLWQQTKRAADAAHKSADASAEAARAARIASEASAALQRPLIGLVSGKQTVIPNVRRWTFSASLRNHGTLPAIRVSASFEFWVDGRQLSSVREPESAEIFPGSAYELNLAVDLGQDNLLAVASGREPLILKLLVKYDSIDERRFEYRAEAVLVDAGTRLAISKSQTLQLTAP